MGLLPQRGTAVSDTCYTYALFVPSGWLPGCPKTRIPPCSRPFVLERFPSLCSRKRGCVCLAASPVGPLPPQRPSEFALPPGAPRVSVPVRRTDWLLIAQAAALVPYLERYADWSRSRDAIVGGAVPIFVSSISSRQVKCTLSPGARLPHMAPCTTHLSRANCSGSGMLFCRCRGTPVEVPVRDLVQVPEGLGPTLSSLGGDFPSWRLQEDNDGHRQETLWLEGDPRIDTISINCFKPGLQ